MELKLASYAIATARAMNEWDARERVSERGKGEENLKNTIISNWMMWKKWKNQQSTSGWGNSASERSESANCCVVASAVRRRNNLLTRSPGRVRFLSSHDIIACRLGRVRLGLDAIFKSHFEMTIQKARIRADVVSREGPFWLQKCNFQCNYLQEAKSNYGQQADFYGLFIIFIKFLIEFWFLNFKVQSRIKKVELGMTLNQVDFDLIQNLT